MYQRGAERLVIHQIAPGRVDQPGSLFHAAQEIFIDDFRGIWRHRHVQADDVAGGGQPFQGHPGQRELLLQLGASAVQTPVAQLTAEGLEASGGGLPDVAHANKAHPAVRQVGNALGHEPFLHFDLPSLPDGPVSGNTAAEQRQHQIDGLFRHGSGIGSPVVADVNTQLPCSIGVNSIVSHPF